MSIVAFVEAAAALIKLLQDVLDWVKELSKDDPAKFISEIHAAFTQVTNAKTPEEKQNAAAAVQDIIKRL